MSTRQQVLFIISIFALNLYAQESKQPIIDMHLHCYDQTNYFVAPDQYGKRAPQNVDEHFHQTYELMKKYNIVKGVISGPFNAVNTWMDRDNDRRFIGGISMFAPGEIDTVQFDEINICLYSKPSFYKPKTSARIFLRSLYHWGSFLVCKSTVVHLTKATLNVARIKKIGRWKDLQTMLRYYHANRADEHEAVNMLSAHLRKKPAEILELKQRL